MPLYSSDFGYDHRGIGDGRPLPKLPPGYYICRAGERVPKVTPGNVYHIRYALPGWLEWEYASDLDCNLRSVDKTNAWPATYAVIITDLPGYGTCDFTNVDEGGIV